MRDRGMQRLAADDWLSWTKSALFFCHGFFIFASP
jgi:hypothetical protein